MKKIIIICTVLSAVLLVTCINLGGVIKKSNEKVIKLESEISLKLQKIDQVGKQIKKLTEDKNKLKMQVEKKYKLDKDLEKLMENWTGNTAEGVDIVCLYGDKWKAKMKHYYNLLYKSLNNNKRKWLISSQNKWDMFTKENEELKWQTYDQINGGGSIMQLFSSEIYLDRYRERTITLMKLYDFLHSSK